VKIITFTQANARKILEGKKWLTTRKLPCRYVVGETLRAKWPSRFGKDFAGLVVTKIETIIPIEEADTIAEGEGFASGQEYLGELWRIHKEKCDWESEMALITFEVVGTNPEGKP
jgi:hypothetical protein